MSSDLAGLCSCPVCAQAFGGHRYALLASIVDNPMNRTRVDNFLTEIKRRNWPNVLRFNEWQGDADVLQLYAIKCPTSRFALVLVRSPFELFDDDQILNTEGLTIDESSTLEDVTRQQNWKPLP